MLRPFKFASSIIIECIHNNVHCQCTMSSTGSKGSLGLTYENMLPPTQCAGHLLTHLLLLLAHTGMAMKPLVGTQYLNRTDGSAVEPYEAARDRNVFICFCDLLKINGVF